MKIINITLLGHSYIRDLKSLGHDNLVVQNCIFKFKYFYKPGATIGSYLSNRSLLEPIFINPPDILFVFLGGNDLRSDWNIHDIILNYKNLITIIKQRLSKSIIICSTIEPRFASARPRFHSLDPLAYKASARKFNNWLRGFRAPDCKFLTWGHNRLENKNLFKSDFVHLNKVGLEILWNLLIDLLIRVSDLHFKDT